MSRRKSLVPREPNGQTKRSLREPEGPSPTSVARLRQALARGQEDPKWSTTGVGMLSSAAKSPTPNSPPGCTGPKLARDYSQACLAPRQPRSANLNPMGGSTIDPDSAQGRREARRDGQTFHRYIASLAALTHAGEAPRAAVAHVVERDQWIAGAMELEHLRTGLSALAEWFGGAQGNNLAISVAEALAYVRKMCVYSSINNGASK